MLPPGVNQKDFSDALKQFEEAVGKEWVFTQRRRRSALSRRLFAVLGRARGARRIGRRRARTPSKQVQAVMKTANEYKIPVYPISTGKNLGYGGSAPNLSGSVVLDLKRMNRILDVSERNHSALVEPGVSYFDLYRYIQERKLKVWVDVPDPGWGSPIGNALDHGGGYLRSKFAIISIRTAAWKWCWPNGDLLRTGMGAMPGAQTWQQYKFGFGPWIDGMFSQSNFGVVTKMGLWLMPEPDAYLTGTVTVPKYDDLVPMVDVLTFLENSGISNGMPSLGSPILGGFMMPPPAPEVTAMLERDGVAIGGVAQICRGQGHSVLELHRQVLWSRESDPRAVGVRAGEVFRDSRRQVSRWRVLQAAADARTVQQGPQARVRHPQPGNVFHRRAIAIQSHAHQRSHLVFAHHSANRRSDARSQQSLLQGREGLWLAAAFLQPADHLLDASRSFSFSVSRSRTTSPPTRRIARPSRKWSASPPTTAGANIAPLPRSRMT